MTMRPNADGLFTVRQRCVVDIMSALESMTDGIDSDTLEPIRVWHKSFRGEITDMMNNSCPFSSLDEGTEDTIEMYGGCTIKELSLMVHFRFQKSRGLDDLDIYQYYLGLIQKALLPIHEDHDLIRDLREEGNIPAVDGIEDAHPGGTVMFVLQYEHAVHDPYRIAGEPA